MTSAGSGRKRCRTKGSPQESFVKCRLDLLGSSLDVAVPPAAPPQQVYLALEQEADSRYPEHDWVQNGFKLSDGTLVDIHELASGRAFAQHQTEICFVPRSSNQNPFWERLETAVQHEVQKQLAEHSALEEQRTTFLAKAPLLRIANDILSFTQAAVLEPSAIEEGTDIWSRPLAQDKHCWPNQENVRA